MEGVLLAHEALHSINENKILAIVIKLDMMKAYDMMNWSLLLKVLRKSRFTDKCCRWIKACISGAFFLVIINRSLVGFFKSSQGVRQGDPLSPTLFILMVETLSRIISSRHSQDLWIRVKIVRTNLLVIHSLFSGWYSPIWIYMHIWGKVNQVNLGHIHDIFQGRKLKFQNLRFSFLLCLMISPINFVEY